MCVILFSYLDCPKNRSPTESSESVLSCFCRSRYSKSSPSEDSSADSVGSATSCESAALVRRAGYLSPVTRAEWFDGGGSGVEFSDVLLDTVSTRRSMSWFGYTWKMQHKFYTLLRSKGPRYSPHEVIASAFRFRVPRPLCVYNGQYISTSVVLCSSRPTLLEFRISISHR